ncbi:hypothetical protein RP20_CCG005416 [Aedes albopictus]|nr:uncharacterized protein LOC109430712 [Aedes albopictus]KXJ78148.1 hypothetical protein RP20_CCG005416 [Aedes albopictus]
MDGPQRNGFGNALIREYASETFCRLCFSQIHELHRLFPPSGQPNKLLVQKIEYCTNVGITFTKDSNACICTKCIALLEEFFRFKQLCNANEQWLKIDGNGDHVAPGRKSPMIADHPSPSTPPRDSYSSSCSLITINSEENVDSDGLPNDDTLQSSCCIDETVVKMEESAEEISFLNNDTNVVTSSGHCMRARRPTTRILQKMPENAMTTITIKSESDSDGEASTSESSDCREFSPVVEHVEDGPDGSQGFSLVRGTKSRKNRLYLVYGTYRYSNRNNDGKIWHCTHRAPAGCRAMVMLEKNRVIELNNHRHNHPPPVMRGRKKINPKTPSAEEKSNVKISLVLKKEKEPRHPPTTRSTHQNTRQSEGNKWFIKANRKTVDGFTYTFCGLRKDGIIRMKCISKGCTGRVYMYSNGDLIKINEEHNHPPHVP